GRTSVEDGVIVGGQTGVADHVAVGAGAMLGAKTGVMSDVPPGARWAGFPAKPRKQWLREAVTLERLAARRRGGDRDEESEWAVTIEKSNTMEAAEHGTRRRSPPQ